MVVIWGIVLFPVWLLWLGLLLRRIEKSLKSQLEDDIEQSVQMRPRTERDSSNNNDTENDRPNTTMVGESDVGL